MMGVYKSRNTCVNVKLVHLNFGSFNEPDFASELGNGRDDLFEF